MLLAGLYIHIPFCKAKCAYCDFPSWPGREGDGRRYLQALLREAALWRQERGPMAFGTVFIGGGTPSLLPAGALERLLDGLRGLFAVDALEFTVEANPGTVDGAKLASFRRAGATRLSFGVQAAQDGLLRRIGRIHSWADFLRSVELARETGFTDINADMMTGLPGQTGADAAETAERLAVLGLTHVSCYGLKLEDGTPLARAVEEGREQVPDDDRERDMFHRAKEVLAAHGLRRYEISNFAQPGYECRHNLNYWQRGDYLGLGCGAASHFAGFRRENDGDLDGYLAALEAGRRPAGEEHRLSRNEQAFEALMLGLRTTRGLSMARYEAEFGVNLYAKWRKTIDNLVNTGLMYKLDEDLICTERGMDLQNTVLLEFME